MILSQVFIWFKLTVTFIEWTCVCLALYQATYMHSHSHPHILMVTMIMMTMLSSSLITQIRTMRLRDIQSSKWSHRSHSKSWQIQDLNTGHLILEPDSSPFHFHRIGKIRHILFHPFVHLFSSIYWVPPLSPIENKTEKLHSPMYLFIHPSICPFFIYLSIIYASVHNT